MPRDPVARRRSSSVLAGLAVFVIVSLAGADWLGRQPTRWTAATAVAVLPAQGDRFAANDSRQAVTVVLTATPSNLRELNRHQVAERRQLNLYRRRLQALLRAHHLVERRLLLVFDFAVPAPVAPIPTPFPF